MTTRDLLLAIDNGTQSLKAMVFDPAGQLLAISKKEFSPYYSPQPGWAEQDVCSSKATRAVAIVVMWRRMPSRRC